MPFIDGTIIKQSTLDMIKAKSTFPSKLTTVDNKLPNHTLHSRDNSILTDTTSEPTNNDLVSDDHHERWKNDWVRDEAQPRYNHFQTLVHHGGESHPKFNARTNPSACSRIHLPPTHWPPPRSLNPHSSTTAPPTTI